MSTKTKVIIVLVSLALAFAGGRYSIPKATVDAQKQVEVDKQKDVKTHTDTTVTKAPDGTTTTHTVTDKDSTTKTDTVSSEHTVVSQKHTNLNVSALVATKVDDLTPMYGASVSKEFVGPVTIGAFALTNGTIGLSVGIDF